MIDPRLLEILCCPSCRGDLVYDKPNQKLICEQCRLRYEIRENIPIMLVAEAETF